MKWPEGYHRPVLLWGGLDDRPDALAFYLHPEELRKYPEIIDELIRARAAEGKFARGISDARRAQLGGIIRQRSLSGQAVLSRYPGLVSVLGPSSEATIRRAEIVHSIHEQKFGCPRNIWALTRSEWVSNAVVFLGRYGSQGFKKSRLPGGVVSRTFRAILYTMAAMLGSRA